VSAPVGEAVCMSTEGSTATRFRVCVWWGGSPIAVYVAERPLAERYAAAVRARFVGLRVTSEPLSSAKDDLRG
jgi:hypothetical protein